MTVGSIEKTMHVGVNTLFHVPGDVGGTETYLLEMLGAIFNEFPRMPVTLFTHRDNDQLLRQKFGNYRQVCYERLPFAAANRPLRILMEQSLLVWRVLRSRVNLLWSPGYTAPFWVGCPQVVTIHDLQYKTYPEDLTFLERKTLDILVRLACRVCSGIIAVSEFSKSELVRFGFAKSNKITAILEAVDPQFGVAVTDHELFAEIGAVVDLQEKYILCVAHTYPHKNVAALIDAFCRLEDRVSHNLILVGKARRGEKEVQQSLSECADRCRIYRFDQGVDYDVLRMLYQNADLFVLPSLYEGFGLPVLEAMMAGTPVITTRQGSLPEVGGRHAHYVEDTTPAHLAAKIAEVCDQSESVRQRTITGAEEWAKSFTWNTAATTTVAYFQTLYDGRRSM